VPVSAVAPWIGAGVLLAAWASPLPGLVEHSFTAHMLLHLLVVAIATPLLAVGLASGHGVRYGIFASVSPVTAALVELVVVWAWHAPGLHHAARTEIGPFIAEQGSFLLTGLLFWGSVVAASRARVGRDGSAAVIALAMTFGHMTWLGALLLLSGRPLYRHGGEPMHALADQHLGGAAMLIVSALAYITGGVLVGRRLLRGTSRLERPA
jgi:putative membrane protein